MTTLNVLFAKLNTLIRFSFIRSEAEINDKSHGNTDEI